MREGWFSVGNRKNNQKETTSLVMSNIHICMHNHTVHMGELSRNQWCVPSCLLHSPTFQLARKTEEKSCHLLWSLKQSRLEVTIVEWESDLKAISWQLLLGGLVWERHLHSPTIASENNGPRGRETIDMSIVSPVALIVLFLVGTWIIYVKYKCAILTVLEASKWLQIQFLQVIT